jgi:hypothetical protein
MDMEVWSTLFQVAPSQCNNFRVAPYWLPHDTWFAAKRLLLGVVEPFCALAFNLLTT